MPEGLQLVITHIAPCIVVSWGNMPEGLLLVSSRKRAARRGIMGVMAVGTRKMVVCGPMPWPGSCSGLGVGPRTDRRVKGQKLLCQYVTQVTPCLCPMTVMMIRGPLPPCGAFMSYLPTCASSCLQAVMDKYDEPVINWSAVKATFGFFNRKSEE